MGQIIGGAAKPKRCNLSQLSQFGTPATGEHILVSSDNSMNAAGQGDFDCYIVGDGRKAATELELKKVVDDKLIWDVVENGVQKSEYAYSHFTARETNSASVTLGTDILLTTEGDYIEIKTKAKTNGQILRRPSSSNPPSIRYSAHNTMQVRFNSSTTWAKQTSALDWNEVQILKVYLDSISGTTYNFKMYVNDTLLGTQAVTDPKGWRQIAYGSTNIDMDIYYIETKIGGVVNRLDKFAEMDGAEYVTDVYTTVDVPSLSELDNRVSNLEADVTILKEVVIGEDMYYSYLKSVSTYNISSAFYIYQRLKDNIYTRATIGYYNYSGSAGYPNGYWRIERINIGTIINNVWTDIQNQAITAGENEFVLKWLAGSDYNFSGGFSGGFHFGETIDNIVGAWVEFVADGNRLSTEEDIPLTPCKSFYYREYSPIFQHKDDTIAAWHLKKTEFKDGGYETINDVKFVQALDYFAYSGIVCVSRWLSEKAMPEGVETIADMGDGSTTIAEQFKSNGHRIHYEGNGYMCDVESEVLIGADDTQCQRVVYNSSAYNKFYRRNPDTAGSTSNRLKGHTKVKISAI